VGNYEITSEGTNLFLTAPSYGTAKGSYHQAVVTFIRRLVKTDHKNDDPYYWQELSQSRTVD